MTSLVKNSGSKMRHLRIAIAVLILLAAGTLPNPGSYAQRLGVPVKVSALEVQTSSSGTTVSISADGLLTRNQAWQDNEGYHVVFPNTVAVDHLRKYRGVKVRRLGTSLEILLQARTGTKVNLQPDGSRLTIEVDGKLLSSADWEHSEPSNSDEQLLFEDNSSKTSQTDSGPMKQPSLADELSAASASANQTAQTSNADYNTGTATGSAPQGPAVKNAPHAGETELGVDAEGDGILASVFSGTSVLIVMSLGLINHLVSRKIRSRQAVKVANSGTDEDWEEVASGDEVQMTNAQTFEAGTSLARGGQSNASPKQALARVPVSGPTTLYGAYRIDQEVGKLLLGQPHRLDVLSSRAVDDRRAIETSLIKGVNSPELDESARRRAREALEEYGFVARQCAALLLAPEPFDRSSAAKALGEIKSPAALPFLLEGLYDSEAIVRNQAVVSIGELKIPSAIGALLDIARTHPDVPSSLLSRTLSACSVEGLDFFDAVPATPAMLGAGDDPTGVEDITHLEPAAHVDVLPEGSEDEQLAYAISQLESQNVDDRAEALKTLAQFRVQSSVGAIALVAGYDPSPGIRSQAITTLGLINHESVFTAVLLGMADEAREVRAAAARSLNRLSFDRADAYARVIESGDEETIRKVAEVCLQSGIVSQNVDRLAQTDPHHAYETFSLICLLAKARMSDPILTAIAGHSNKDVRLKLVHLLGCTGQPEVFEQLRQLAVNDGVSEEVKTSLLEAMYKLDQARRSQDEQIEHSSIRDESTEDVTQALPEEFNSDFEIASENQLELDESDF